MGGTSSVAANEAVLHKTFHDDWTNDGPVQIKLCFRENLISSYDYLASSRSRQRIEAFTPF